MHEHISLPPSHSVECFRQEKLKSLPQIWCFPHAGAGAAEFRTWAAGFGPDLLVCAIRYPGRERRFDESAATDLAGLAQALAEDIKPLISSSSIFYGQCFGALVAFEVLLKLSRTDATLPQHFYAASQMPPQFLIRIADEIRPPNDPMTFRKKITDIGGFPRDLENNEKLWELAEPALRGDYQIIADYAVNHRPERIPLPITALMGTNDDNSALGHQLIGWEACTTAAFEFRTIPGGHFLSRGADKEVAELLTREIRR